MLDVVFTGSSLAELGDVHEDVDGLLNLQVDHADVDGLIVLLLLLRRSIAVNLISLFINTIFSLFFLLHFVLVMIFLMEILPFNISRQILIVLPLLSFITFFVVLFAIKLIIDFLSIECFFK